MNYKGIADELAEPPIALFSQTAIENARTDTMMPTMKTV